MATNAEKDLEELKAEFAELKSDVSKLTDTLKNLYGDSTAEGREWAKRRAEQTRERAREAVGTFETEIGERPLTSVAAAFGVGFIIGRLLDR